MVLDLWRYMGVADFPSATLAPEFASAFNAKQHLRKLKKSKRRISTVDKSRMVALVQIAAVLGVEFLASNSLDLIQEIAIDHEEYPTSETRDLWRKDDLTLKGGNFWGQDFFLHGTTKVMLKKAYRGQPVLNPCSQLD